MVDLYPLSMPSHSSTADWPKHDMTWQGFCIKQCPTHPFLFVTTTCEPWPILRPWPDETRSGGSDCRLRGARRRAKKSRTMRPNFLYSHRSLRSHWRVCRWRDAGAHRSRVPVDIRLEPLNFVECQAKALTTACRSGSTHSHIVYQCVFRKTLGPSAAPPAQKCDRSPSRQRLRPKSCTKAADPSNTRDKSDCSDQASGRSAAIVAVIVTVMIATGWNSCGKGLPSVSGWFSADPARLVCTSHLCNETESDVRHQGAS